MRLRSPQGTTVCPCYRASSLTLLLLVIGAVPACERWLSSRSLVGTRSTKDAGLRTDLDSDARAECAQARSASCSAVTRPRQSLAGPHPPAGRVVGFRHQSIRVVELQVWGRLSERSAFELIDRSVDVRDQVRRHGEFRFFSEDGQTQRASAL